MPDLLDNVLELTVSELSQKLKRSVEDQFGHVRVRGEISGFKRAPSGHLYLTLKDADACLDAVMWKGTAGGLRFKPEDGFEVVCTGRLTTYPGRSKYQIIVERMEPAGAGALLAQLEERRKKLAAEGLFDASRKRRLPFLPEVIGVVTSPTGAVIRDILHRLGDRFPRHVLVWPVLVQGEKAAGEIAAAIAGFNALTPQGRVPRPDLLIVARGGGSIEDLWAFNEEIVVRAAAASTIPLISAVGHETDTTLIDHASDRRAPTPTAAAEMAVPVRADLLANVMDYSGRLLHGQTRLIEQARMRLLGAARALPRPLDLLSLARQRFDGAAERLRGALRENLRQHEVALVRASAQLRPQAIAAEASRQSQRLRELDARRHAAFERRLSRAQDRLAGVGKLLMSVSHEAVLARGFVLVEREGGTLLHRRGDAKPEEAVTLHFADGRVGAVLEGTAPSAPRRKGPKSGQGELF